MSQGLPISQSTRLSPVYVADGILAQFDAGFPAQNADDITVYRIDDNGNASTPWSLNTDYTVSNLAPATDVRVVFASAPAAGVRLRIGGDAVLQRLSNITSAGKYRSAAIEGELDRLTMVAQEVDTALAGVLRGQPGEVLPALPTGSDRANKVLGTDSLGAFVLLSPETTVYTLDGVHVSSYGTDSTAARSANDEAVARNVPMIVDGPINQDVLFNFSAPQVVFMPGGYVDDTNDAGGTFLDSCKQVIAGPYHIFRNFDADSAAPSIKPGQFEYLMPEHFGARRDGATDDKATISKALFNANYTDVRLLAGTYAVNDGTDTGIQCVYSRRGLRGAGINRTTLHTGANATSDGVRFVGRETQKLTTPFVQDFRIDKDNTGTGGVGIGFSFTSSGRIERVQAEGFRIGIKLLRAPNTEMRDCVASFEGPDTGTVGIELDGSGGASGHGLRVDTTVTSGVVTAAVLNDGGAGYSVGEHVKVSDGSATVQAILRIDTVSGGAVTGFTIMHGGSGYSSSYSDVICTGGGGGSGLKVDTTTTGGGVTAISVSAGGNGYAVGDFAVIEGSSTQMAFVKVSAVTGGVVTAATIEGGGAGYADDVGVNTNNDFYDGALGNASTTLKNTSVSRSVADPTARGLYVHGHYCGDLLVKGLSTQNLGYGIDIDLSGVVNRSSGNNNIGIAECEIDGIQLTGMRIIGKALDTADRWTNFTYLNGWMNVPAGSTSTRVIFNVQNLTGGHITGTQMRNRNNPNVIWWQAKDVHNMLVSDIPVLRTAKFGYRFLANTTAGTGCTGCVIDGAMFNNIYASVPLEAAVVFEQYTEKCSASIKALSGYVNAPPVDIQAGAVDNLIEIPCVVDSTNFQAGAKHTLHGASVPLVVKDAGTGSKIVAPSLPSNCIDAGGSGWDIRAGWADVPNVTLAPETGAFTAATIEQRFRYNGEQIEVDTYINVTDITGASGSYFKVSLPFTAAPDSRCSMFGESSAHRICWARILPGALDHMRIFLTTGTSAASISNGVFHVRGTYKRA